MPDEGSTLVRGVGVAPLSQPANDSSTIGTARAVRVASPAMLLPGLYSHRCGRIRIVEVVDPRNRIQGGAAAREVAAISNASAMRSIALDVSHGPLLGRGRIFVLSWSVRLAAPPSNRRRSPPSRDVSARLRESATATPRSLYVGSASGRHSAIVCVNGTRLRAPSVLIVVARAYAATQSSIRARTAMAARAGPLRHELGDKATVIEESRCRGWTLPSAPA